MDDTQLQIIISAVNNAAPQLSEVGAQLSGLGTQAGEASAQISSSLNAAEEAAADAAIATANQWDESLEEVSSAVSEAATSATSSFASICGATIWMRILRRAEEPYWRSRRVDDCRGATGLQGVF
jgi:hypothetical protein